LDEFGGVTLRAKFGGEDNADDNGGDSHGASEESVG
jgi:hypothetical protein